MKLLHTNKVRIAFLLCAIFFVFKLVAVHEYIHIKQHKEERIHQENCQICHTIFQVGKYQTFEASESYSFHPIQIRTKYNRVENQYNFIYYRNINPSELFNRPPPVLS